MEKEKATYSNILAWEIPWTEEPGGLQSMGSQKSQTRLYDYQGATCLGFRQQLSTVEIDHEVTDS